MKNSISHFLYYLVLLAVLLQGSAARNTFPQVRQSREVKLSHDTWPKDELEKYWQLQVTYNRPNPTVEGKKGMVAVTTDALAARVGMEALQQGGSAADAALATALTQIVLTAGSAISYAGMLTMVYYDAASNKVYSLNAGYNTVLEEKEPLTIPGIGIPSGRTVLVPGFFAGVQAAHNRFGKLPFASIFGPAIHLADKGFNLDGSLGWRIDSQKNVLTRLPETKRVFTKETGELYKAGDLFKQPQLAETLRKVAAQGTDYIYQGEWAKKFVAAVQSEGGKMTLADLKAYRAIWSEPVQTSYHGYQVYSLGQPSIGGVNTIEALNLLELADLKRFGHYTSSPESLYEFIQICRVGQFLPYLPPEFVKMYLPGLDLAPESRVKKDNARLLWRKMHEPGWEKMVSTLRPKPLLFRSKPALPSATEEGEEPKPLIFRIKPALPSATEKGEEPKPLIFRIKPALPSATEKGKASNHSAGVVAVDRQGNMAALLHSINGGIWGTHGIFVDGISIPESASFQQTEIAKLKPGSRLPETTNPVIALKNGKPYLASSSIGSPLHQITMNNLANVLDFGMDLKKSIDTPNFRGPFWGMVIGGGPPSPQVYKEALAEGDFAEKLVEAVIAKGQDIKLLSKMEAGHQSGLWVAILIDPKTGMRIGAAPTGANGAPAGY